MPADFSNASESFKRRNPHLFHSELIQSVNGVDHESDLHNQIMDHCSANGWLYFHGAMCKRTYRTLGEPDFIILRPRGVLFVECKARKQKQSPAQRDVAAHAAKLGHTVHVVRSIEEFKKLCEQSGKETL